MQARDGVGKVDDRVALTGGRRHGVRRGLGRGALCGRLMNELHLFYNH
jgi:hypothetical protein